MVSLTTVYITTRYEIFVLRLISRHLEKDFAKPNERRYLIVAIWPGSFFCLALDWENFVQYFVNL